MSEPTAQTFRFEIAHQGGQTLAYANVDSLVIGRSSQADFTIPHDSVSREHLKVIVREGEIWLMEMGSSNGTMVNGKRLKPNLPIRLRPEHPILVGDEGVVLFIRPLEGKGAAIKPAPDLDPHTFSGVLTRVTAPEPEAQGQAEPETSPSVATPTSPSVPIDPQHPEDARLQVVYDPEGSYSKSVVESQAPLMVRPSQNPAKREQKAADAALDQERIKQAQEIERLARERIVLMDQVEKVRSELLELESRAQAQRDQITENQQRDAELSQKVAKLRSQLDTELAAERADFDKALEVLRLETEREIMARRRAAKAELDDSRKDAELELRKQRAEIETALAERKTKRARLESEIEEILLGKTRIEKERDLISLEVDKIRHEEQRLRSEAEELKLERDRARAEIAEIGSRSEAATEALVAVTRSLGELRASLAGMQEERDRALAEIQGLRKQAQSELQAERERWMEETRQARLALEAEAEKARSLALVEARSLREQGLAELALERKKAETYAAELRADADREHGTAIGRIEMDIARRKAIAQAEEQAARERSELELRERMQGRVREVSKSIEERLASKLAPFTQLTGSPELLSECLKEIRAVVETALIPAKSKDAEDRIRKVLPVDPRQSAGARRFWKRMGIGAALVVASIAAEVVSPGTYSRIAGGIGDYFDQRRGRSEALEKKLQAERIAATVYRPQQDRVFKASYTDNVLFTEGFVRMKGGIL